MKIKYVTDDCLNAIRQNYVDVYKKVIVEEQMSLTELFMNEDFVKDAAFEVEDFTLDMSQEKSELTDFENVKRVYTHLKMLSDSQAADERLWAGMAFAVPEFFKYMKYRWGDAGDQRIVENRYLFGYSAQRSLFRNGLARLWWIGRNSYDEDRMDPFEMTELLCRKLDIIDTMSSRNMFNNPHIFKPFIKAFKDAETAGYDLSRALIRDVAKYMNTLSATYIMDIMEEEWIYNKVYTRIETVGNKVNS